MTTRDALKAGLWSALWTFVGLFVLTSIGWLQDVAAWASTSGAEPLPDLSVLGFGVVSAFAAAAVLLLNAVFRLAQNKGVLPGHGPSYDDPATSAGPVDTHPAGPITHLDEV